MRTIILVATVMSLLTTGYAQDADTTTKLSGSTVIDKWVKAKWEEAGLKPAKKADEAEFMRRAYLDIIGVIPSLEEAEKYLADKSPNRRQKLVESLMKDEHYGEHWADVWSGILVGFESNQRATQARSAESHDVRILFNKNMPFA